MNLRFKQATRIFTKTLPFVWLRIAVGVAFGVFALLYFGFVGVMLYSLGDVSSVIFLLLVVATVGIFFAILRLLRKYVVYMVSAGHTAVIAHIVETGHVPEDQVSFGKNKVTNNFAEANGLFVVDKLIKAVLNQFNSAVISVSNLLGFVPALKNLLTVIRKSVVLAGSYLDQAILAHIFLHEETGRWTAARDGIVLYGKTWKPVLASAMVIVVGGYVAFALLAVLLSPVALAVGQLSSIGQLLGWAVVGGIIVTVHFGFVGPWIQTVIITTFLEESRGKTTDSETMDFIAGKASKFRELAENAANERGGGSSGGTPSHGGQPGAGGGAGGQPTGCRLQGHQPRETPQQRTAGTAPQEQHSSQQPTDTGYPQQQQGRQGTNPQAGQAHSSGYEKPNPSTDQKTTRNGQPDTSKQERQPQRDPQTQSDLHGQSERPTQPDSLRQSDSQQPSGSQRQSEPGGRPDSQEHHTQPQQPVKKQSKQQQRQHSGAGQANRGSEQAGRQNQQRTQGGEQQPQSGRRSQRPQQGRQHSRGPPESGGHANSNSEYARQTRQNHNPNYGEQSQQNQTPNYQQSQQSYGQHNHQTQENSEPATRHPQQNRSQTGEDQTQSQSGDQAEQSETERTDREGSVPGDSESGSR